MSKTVFYVLLKVLMLARTDILSMDLDLDFIEENPVSKNNDIIQIFKFNWNRPDSVSVRNKIDEIPFANTSVISESIDSILSKPTSPRAFVEFHNGFLNKKNISVIFRWNQPQFADEVIQGYTVRCWFIENLKEIQICNDKSTSATILECKMRNVKPNTTYYFQARAHTKVGAGPYTDLINVSTTHENPIPRLLMVTKNGIDLWDMDSKINVNLVKDKKEVIDVTYSIAEHKIFWSNEGRELMILEINENKITKISKLQNIARHLCIDWVARNLYWIERNLFNYDNIIKLDLTRLQNGIVKYNKILKLCTFFDTPGLTLLPSTGLLYWTNFTMNFGHIPVISDLNGKSARIFRKNLLSVCSPVSLTMFNFRYMKISNINKYTKEKLIYWLFDNSLLVTNINVSICNLILNAKNIDQISFESLDIDKTNVYIHNKYDDSIYVLEKKYALLETVNAFKYIQKIKPFSPINKIHAFGKSLQSYPPMRCLTPDKKVYNVEELTYMVTTNSIIINIPETIPKSGCKKYNLPSTLYTINITSHCVDNKLNFDDFTVQTYERYYEFQNLTSLTEYKLLLVMSNFYFNLLSMDPLIGSEVILRTKPSKLDVPENVTVEALTPTVAAVYWTPSKKLNCVPVIYKVCWMLIINNTRQINKLLINKTEECTVDSKFFTTIEPLIPEQQYKVYVRVYSANLSDHYNDSASEILYMYPEPNNITLNDVSTNSMDILWIPSVNLTIHYILQYKNVEDQEWQIARNFEPNGEQVIYYIKNLLSGTRYVFRLILRYPKYVKNCTWPSDERFVFSTLTSDISGIPGWILQHPREIALVLISLIIITGIYACIRYFCRLYRHRNVSNKQVLPPTELEILSEMSRESNEVFNTLYRSVLQHNSDENVLTEIKREDISIGKFLGRGAFGEVFLGKVQNFGNLDTEISVAIKRLKKNASCEEKEKFLEEAKLMNNFRHEHVLRLLGVCLDQVSPLIVLELMEVDLLRYLRDCRELQLQPDLHNLRLQDLLSMCEDVARGCCYLENLHFIHRDLACRNCLVSDRNRENRVIKIGDFGMAKDIYNDHYYRVKGQSPLPVCWMAPESLVFGKFTSQSDVWSFGVLMWEITSLGEHPYTGKTNEEVIDYVRTGDRLSMPLNCPPTLYELMRHCWSPEADDRPNFNNCLENIIGLRNTIEDTLLKPVSFS